MAQFQSLEPRPEKVRVKGYDNPLQTYFLKSVVKKTVPAKPNNQGAFLLQNLITKLQINKDKFPSAEQKISSTVKKS